MVRTMRHTRSIMMLLGICSAFTLLLSACTVSRIPGKGRQLGSYDYLLVSESETGEYFKAAAGILDQSFVVLYDDDPRLNVRSIHQKTCTVSIGWAPGFWSTSGWVDVKDLASGAPVHTSHMRRGGFWTGSHADVMEAIRDVAAARAAGPPLPADARESVSFQEEPDVGRARPRDVGNSKADRLRELNELRVQGLITDPEYSRQRAKILDE